MTSIAKKLRTFVVLGSLLVVVNVWAKGDEAPASSYDKTYHEVVQPMVDIATHEGTGESLNVMQQTVVRAKQAEDNLRGGVANALAGRSGAARRTGNKLVKGSLDRSKEFAKEISWLEKAKRFGQLIDIVSTGAKVAAYLAEGDRGGAAHVLTDDACKKVCAAGGAFVLSWIPGVGTIAGAAEGEEAYKAYLRPKLEKFDQELREKAAVDSQLKHWLTKEIIIDRSGNSRELGYDAYFDREAGVIKTRSPQEQATYEEQQRLAFFDSQKLNAIYEKYMEGRLSRSEYDRAIASYGNRDPSKPWQPPKLEEKEVPVDDKPGDGKILEFVDAVRVTATGLETTELPNNEVATTVVTVTFWNVGNLAPKHGEAKVTLVTTSNAGSKETETCSGTFSGGPNGRLTVSCDGETGTLQLNDGKTILDPDGHVLTIKNPDAFKNWPASFR